MKSYVKCIIYVHNLMPGSIDHGIKFLHLILIDEFNVIIPTILFKVIP